jgi:hypothetical protein
VHTFALGNFEAFRRPSCTENLQTYGARDLQRCDTDAATCAVYQDRLGSMCFRGVMKRMICGSVRYPESGALLEINLFRKRMHLLLESECVFRIRPGEGSRRVYAIALLHFLDSLADRFNDTGTIRSGSVWKCWLHGISARAHVGIIGIDPGRMNAHQDLARWRFWRRHIL